MSRVPAKVFVLKFRPSSHSDDYTMIATYKDEQTAEKVGKVLRKLVEDMKKRDDYDIDWNPDETTINVDGKQVWFEVYTAGYLDDVESVLRKVAAPENVECYKDYQELTVRATVPKGLTPETSMIVLDREEAEAIKWFNEECGKPTVTDCEDGKHQVFEWHYEGEGISDNSTLYVGFEFNLSDHENWEVE